jgi:hypothetical protein
VPFSHAGPVSSRGPYKPKKRRSEYTYTHASHVCARISTGNPVGNHGGRGRIIKIVRPIWPRMRTRARIVKPRKGVNRVRTVKRRHERKHRSDEGLVYIKLRLLLLPGCKESLFRAPLSSLRHPALSALGRSDEDHRHGYRRFPDYVLDRRDHAFFVKPNNRRHSHACISHLYSGLADSIEIGGGRERADSIRRSVYSRC